MNQNDKIKGSYPDETLEKMQTQTLNVQIGGGKTVDGVRIKLIKKWRVQVKNLWRIVCAITSETRDLVVHHLVSAHVFF
jgi:hypothetical protein